MVFEVVLPALDEVKVRLYKESAGKSARKMRSWACSLHSLVPSDGSVAVLGMTFVWCWLGCFNLPAKSKFEALIVGATGGRPTWNKIRTHIPSIGIPFPKRF